MDKKTSDEIHQEPSQSTTNLDAVECFINTNDFKFDSEVGSREAERQRELTSSRRDSSTKRSTRHSPTSSSFRKHHLSPRSNSSSTRSHRQHHPSQRYHRASTSPSPPPPPPVSSSSSSTKVSSRYHRPTTSTKRPLSRSRSPYERRSATNRPRRDKSKERNPQNVLQMVSSPEEQIKIKPKTSRQETTTELTFVSEDESTKPREDRTNTKTSVDSPSTIANSKLHSTPSVPVLQPNANESLLETSNISQEYELSLFPKSLLSTPTTSSMIKTPTMATNDVMQTIELISKYKMMQAVPCNDPIIEACSKEILMLIQKQNELQKIELDYREREIKLRERELAEREKRFIERPTDSTTVTAIVSEPIVTTKSIINEEKPQEKLEVMPIQETKEVSEEAFSSKTILSTDETKTLTVTNTNNTDQPSTIRKKTGKSRFSPSAIIPLASNLQENPSVDLYSDDNDNIQSTFSLNAANLKNSTISKVLAPTESSVSMVDTDLKVTSSNSCRTVEFQSGNIDKSTTNKGTSHDLRLTLSKNRTQHKKTNDNNGTIVDQLNSDDELPMPNKKIMPSKVHAIKDDKQQSHDYHQQRSVTSSIEFLVDNNTDKRDNRRRQQRFNSSRQAQYATLNSPSTNTSSKERSYNYDLPFLSAPKYGSNLKRHENDDLRSQLYKHKHSKTSRTTHRNNN